MYIDVVKVSSYDEDSVIRQQQDRRTGL